MREAPLVLLHSYPLDARMWDPLRPRMAERTRLITPDQRGLGEAVLPEDGTTPSLDTAARDVLALLDRLDLDTVVLGGCSMGGYVAQSVLRLAPERISGLVLLDTKATVDAGPARDARLETARRAETEGTGGWLADAMLPKLLGETTRASRPDLVETVRGFIEDQDPGGIAWAQRAMAARADATEVLAATDVPALVVVGAEDTVTPPEVARDLAHTLPDAELAVVADAGHSSPLEDPGAVADAILSLLDRVPAGR